MTRADPGEAEGQLVASGARELHGAGMGVGVGTAAIATVRSTAAAIDVLVARLDVQGRMRVGKVAAAMGWCRRRPRDRPGRQADHEALSATAQHRAIVEALGLSPADLRNLAMEIESAKPTQLVRDIAQAEIDARREHHRYVPSLHRLIAWAGDTDASTVTADQIDGWARRAGKAARTRANARHGVGAEEAFVLAVRAAAVAPRSGVPFKGPRPR